MEEIPTTPALIQVLIETHTIGPDELVPEEIRNGARMNVERLSNLTCDEIRFVMRDRFPDSDGGPDDTIIITYEITSGVPMSGRFYLPVTHPAMVPHFPTL